MSKSTPPVSSGTHSNQVVTPTTPPKLPLIKISSDLLTTLCNSESKSSAHLTFYSFCPEILSSLDFQDKLSEFLLFSGSLLSLFCRFLLIVPTYQLKYLRAQFLDPYFSKYITPLAMSSSPPPSKHLRPLNFYLQ